MIAPEIEVREARRIGVFMISAATASAVSGPSTSRQPLRLISGRFEFGSWCRDARDVSSGKHAGHQHSPDREQQTHRSLPSYDAMVTCKRLAAKREDRLCFTFRLET